VIQAKTSGGLNKSIEKKGGGKVWNGGICKALRGESQKQVLLLGKFRGGHEKDTERNVTLDVMKVIADMG